MWRQSFRKYERHDKWFQIDVNSLTIMTNLAVKFGAAMAASTWARSSPGPWGLQSKLGDITKKPKL